MSGNEQPEQPHVLTERNGQIITLSLNRPDQRNALLYESWTQLGSALARVREQEECHAVILTGTGTFFGAGGDIKTAPSRGTSAMAPAARVEHAQRVMSQLRALPIPVIAAVEGGAVGLAWSLVLSCDLVIATTNVFFSAPFVGRAVVPDGGLAWRLTRHLGRIRATNVLLRGARVSAGEAESLGLVTELVEPGAALARAIAVANELGDADQGAVELTKRLIEAAETSPWDSFLPLELTMAVLAQNRASQRGRPSADVAITSR